MKRKTNYKIVPDSLRTDDEPKGGKRGRRDLPIDSTPLFQDLLEGLTVFVMEVQPLDGNGEEIVVDSAFQKRLYSRFHYAFDRRMHAEWTTYRGVPGVILWLDPAKAVKARSAAR